MSRNKEDRSLLLRLIAKSTDLMNDASDDKALLANVRDFQEKQLQQKLNGGADQYQEEQRQAEQQEQAQLDSQLKQRFGWMARGLRTDAERQDAEKQMKQNIRIERMVAARNGHLTDLKRKSAGILQQAQYTRVGVRGLSNHRQAILLMKTKRQNPRQQLT